MKTRLIPLIVMLGGGAVWCAIALLKDVDLRRMLWTLLIVLIVFFAIGCIFRYLIEKHLDNVLNPPEPEPEEESEEGEEGENSEEGENTGDDEGSYGENSEESEDESGTGSLFSDEP